MKRTLKKLVGALLTIGLLVQAFGSLGKVSIYADEYVVSSYEENEQYDEYGCRYEGTTLTSVPYDATEIVIRKGTTAIGDWACINHENLTAVTIPDSVESIGTSAFFGNTNLKKIVIGKGLKTIAYGAFYNCGFDSLKLPASIESIGENAFGGTSQNITIAKGCKNFSTYKSGIYTSDYKTLICYPREKTSIKFHPNCTGYNSGVFNDSKIKKLVLPDAIETLSSYDFENAKNLKSVEIGKNVKEIAFGVFYGCSALEKITVSKDNKYFASYKGALYTKDMKTLVYFPEGMKKVQMNASTTSFRSHAISSAYYNTEVICSDNIDDFEKLGLYFMEKQDGVVFTVKAGTASAIGLGNRNGSLKYNLKESEAEIIKLVDQGSKDITVKVGTAVRPGYNLAGLHVSDAFDDTNSACKISWKISDKKIASISDDGLIVGIKAGKTTLKGTLTLKGGAKKTFEYNVTVEKGKLKKGDIVCMGSYEQDGNEKNGAEPIYWDVLNVKNGKALLLSRKVLEDMVYGGSEWKGSSIRTWLNGTFYDKSFTSSEKKKIQKTKLDNSVCTFACDSFTAGNTTTDKVFLLSVKDISNSKYGFNEKYLADYTDTEAVANDLNRRCSASEYVMKMNDYDAYRDSYTKDGRISYTWWLRTYRETTTPLVISHNGSLRLYGFAYEGATCGVRPAMWISA